MTILTEPTNSDRADYAEAALIAFARLTGSDYIDALPDLLCDLMHWADENEFDFTEALARARGHHAFEVSEAEEVQP